MPAGGGSGSGAGGAITVGSKSHPQHGKPLMQDGKVVGYVKRETTSSQIRTSVGNVLAGTKKRVEYVIRNPSGKRISSGGTTMSDAMFTANRIKNWG